RRIGDYLAAELRGQLVDRDVTVTVHDRMARGRAQKVRRVEPVRFAGDRLALPETLAVPGHGPIRVELYLVPEGGEPGRVSVACGGTVVYDDLAAALDGRFAPEPWTAGRVAGRPDCAEFAAGPLARVGVGPVGARVERWGERRLRARATDGWGARVGGVECTWALVEGPGSVEATGPMEAAFRAAEATGMARVAVTARKGGRE